VTNIHLRRLVAAASIGATALALAACGTGSSSSSSTSSSTSSTGGVKAGPGVDASTKTITIGNIGATTGPAGPLGIPALNGAKAAVDQINAAGGIDGWKLKILFKDAAYVPQNQVQAYNAINGQIAVLQSFGSPTTKAIQSQIDSAKLVTAPLSWDSAWSKDPNLAPVGTPYAIDIANGLHYLTTVKGLGKKTGIIYQNDEYGADGLRGAQAAAKAGYIDLVAQASEAVGDTDFTSQVEKMKSAGADIVVVTALPSAAGPIVGTAASLGYTPTYLFQGPSYVEQLITTNGTLGAKPTPIAGALAKSTYVMSFTTPWGNPKAPGTKKLIAAQKLYAPNQIPSIYFSWAYAQTEVLADILRKAVQSGDLTRQGILNARHAIPLIHTGGLTPPVNYTTVNAPPSTVSIINRINPTVQGFLTPVAASISSPIAQSLG
jgi:ABC-type branched-subunit amino acid transport system substrate-binding protein